MNQSPLGRGPLRRHVVVLVLVSVLIKNLKVVKVVVVVVVKIGLLTLALAWTWAMALTLALTLTRTFCLSDFTTLTLACACAGAGAAKEEEVSIRGCSGHGMRRLCVKAVVVITDTVMAMVSKMAMVVVSREPVWIARGELSDGLRSGWKGCNKNCAE